MIAVADSSVLLHLLNPGLPAPAGPDGKVPTHCRERIDHFIETLSRSGGRLLIPTPALAEVLTKAGRAGQDWLAAIQGKKAVRIAEFDSLAAIECAALASGRKHRVRTSTRDKAKFDEQIVAIALAEQADLILSDDTDIPKIAAGLIEVRGIWSLDLPASAAQWALPYDKAAHDL